MEQSLKKEKKIISERRRLEYIRTAESRAQAKIDNYENESKRLSNKLIELVNKKNETEKNLIDLRSNGSWGEDVEVMIELFDYLKDAVLAVEHVINERLLANQEDGKEKKQENKRQKTIVCTPISTLRNMSGARKSKSQNVFQAKSFLLKQRLRTNSIIILMSYDVPGKPRTSIINALMHEFQGEFEYNNASIDDVLLIQELLQKNGRSVILSVNSGLNSQSRDTFIQKVFFKLFL